MTSTIPTLFQGVDKGSAGYKLLAMMGWKEGEGLGADKQGIKEHLRVKKNVDGHGIGAIEQAQQTRDWTTGMMSFDQILSKLKTVSSSDHLNQSSDTDSDEEEEDKKVKKSKKKGKKRKNNNESSSSKSKKQKKGKQDDGEKSSKKSSKKSSRKKKSESSSEESEQSSVSSDSDNSSSSSEDEAPVPQRVKIASHMGRYQRRETAKFVRGYSAEDLTAILGGVSNGAPSQPAATTAIQTKEVKSESPEKTKEHEEDKVKKEKKEGKKEEKKEVGKKEKKEKNKKNKDKGKEEEKTNTSQPELEESKEENKEEKETPTQNEWWRSMFVRVGDKPKNHKYLDEE
uniref:G-patch domain-containing protein n=1 Tax=Polytomella parva TaxID=51329 RepID=A0A7S0YMG4_9CHLO|eukprot:CAMPEP_0175073960 /NCGR_PEP_ID=MMETSP0052_2-20121109/20944_1 /TAXON_ID=51329 ORGANISM="Polytomella parva, Strain SAG 63-3" /NCGR_SAMPLE_ID=MMETSP0052_2 /ASSEMBLY_ACC=CAM_ASM_000194 /LENGTH=341 /DNA_ID=CAMNT_0016342011 /DNA_START=28 /DNA_END=1053 /DNA_ORIENTATION=+